MSNSTTIFQWLSMNREKKLLIRFQYESTQVWKCASQTIVISSVILFSKRLRAFNISPPIVSIRPVHITSEKFGNAALFLQLGLPSTLIRHENGPFQKRSLNQKDLKTPAFCFRVGTENILKTELSKTRTSR